MKWRLFSIAAVLSCALGVGVAASWIRSHSVYDQIWCGSPLGRHQCVWESYSASFQFQRWPPGIPAGASVGVFTSLGKVLLQHAAYGRAAPGGSSRGYGWASDENVVPSFSYFYAVTGDMGRSGQWTVRQVTVRHWALVLLFAVLPLAWLLAPRRRNLRTAPRAAQGGS